MGDLLSYLEEVIINFIAPGSMAQFLVMMIGVFAGFLLSYNSYRKLKDRKQIELELKYTRLAIKEMESNKKTFKRALEDIEKYLADTELYENLSDEELLKGQNLFIGLCQYLKTLITNETLTSCYSIGAVRPLMIDEVYDAFNLFQLAYKALEPHQLNLEKGGKLKVKGCIEFINRLHGYCIELIDIYEEAVNCLEALESELMDNRSFLSKAW